MIQKLIALLTFLAKLTVKTNSKPLYGLFFLHYVLNKLKELLNLQLKLQCLPDNVFLHLVAKFFNCDISYVDQNLYVLGNIKCVKTVKCANKWYCLIYKHSKRKYKVIFLPFDNIPENVIFVSESMKYNIDAKFKRKSNNSFFHIFPTKEDVSSCWLKEVKISLITTSTSCSNDIISNLLKTFFQNPRYLRINDVFCVNLKYVPEVKYNFAYLKLCELYFKVNSISPDCNSKEGFAVFEGTTLIQESDINCYLPCRCSCDIASEFNSTILGCFCVKTYSPSLEEPLDYLISCVKPFLQSDSKINIKPIFLLEGPEGSGKTKMIKAASRSLGLNLLETDFAEIQSLTTAQTEAKIRIIMASAENIVPCILMMQNIQIFGINAEGQKDDRVIASFLTEIKKLYNKKLKFPVIIITTSTETQISMNIEKVFLETINLKHLEHNERFTVLCWFLKRKNLKYNADLQKISVICSDFTLADFEALVNHAVKFNFKKNISVHKEFEELSDEDFTHAYEYMQSIFSDRLGAPRVPKVFWKDIGGLSDLKKEIIRRIEMPLCNFFKTNRSGILLYGPPGTGKTLLAKAVATEFQLNFLSVKGPELLNMYVGQSEKNIRQVFDRARSASPCIIFFDELDSLAPNRGQSGDSGGVMDRVVSQLLAEMDGLESSGKIFIIGATNRPDLLDPALLRPGRFDKMLYVGIYSDLDSQISVLKAQTRHFKMENDGQELNILAKNFPSNLTGADLYSVCSNAWLQAVRRTFSENHNRLQELYADDIVVKMEDFISAAQSIVPSVSEEELLRYKKLRNELSSK